MVADILLHPAFGLDEDWNFFDSLCRRCSGIASSLRAGWGLKLLKPCGRWNGWVIASSLRAGWGLKRTYRDRSRGSHLHCIQPSGWMRIETSRLLAPHTKIKIASSLRAGWGLKHKPLDPLKLFHFIASSLRAGWGLKHFFIICFIKRRSIASSLRAGWGLKQDISCQYTLLFHCIQPSGWMRIETNASNPRSVPGKLHPAFGLDEDWNQACARGNNPPHTLHPAFGLDEDWNYEEPVWAEPEQPLHPAFGLGEDWNYEEPVWAEPEQPLHPAFGLDEDWNTTFRMRTSPKFNCIQPSGWVRIETQVSLK